MILKCPECKADSKIPSLQATKITCTGCGMILVIKKILGEGWVEKARQAAATAAAETRRSPMVKKKTDAAPADKSRPPRVAAKAPAAAQPEEAPAPVGRSRSRTTRGRAVGEVHHERTGGHPGHRRKPAVSPALLWTSIGALIVGVVVVVVVLKKTPPDKPKVHKHKDEAAMTSDTDMPAAEAPKVEEPTAAPANAEPKAETPKSTSGGKKPKPAKEPKGPLTPFVAGSGVTEEQFAAATKAVEVLKDLNATRELNKAREELEATPKAAIPALINGLIGLDLASKEDTERGFQMVQELSQIADASSDRDSFFGTFRQWPADNERQIESDKSQRDKSVRWWHEFWKTQGPTWEPPKPEGEEGEEGK